MPYSSAQDLRGKHPNQTYQYIVLTDGTSVFDGMGSQILDTNVTSSHAISSSYSLSASYEINYETSSSYAEVSDTSSFASNAAGLVGNPDIQVGAVSIGTGVLLYDVESAGGILGAPNIRLDNQQGVDVVLAGLTGEGLVIRVDENIGIGIVPITSSNSLNSFSASWSLNSFTASLSSNFSGSHITASNIQIIDRLFLENCSAFGPHSIAFGSDTVASGQFSHAEGTETSASGQFSHAEGSTTDSIGDYSHAEGNSTTSNGLASHAEGYSSNANGLASHAEGNTTYAIGNYSHAEGILNNANGLASHAEGSSTISNGDYSHAEGDGTYSFGNYSHAEGSSTTAFADGSHAEGHGTIASGSGQHAEGRFNTQGNSTSLVIIGNGTDDANRSDLALFNSQSIVFNQPLQSFPGSGSASTTPSINGSMTTELKDNNLLIFRVRGYDGIVRSGSLSLI